MLHAVVKWHGASGVSNESIARKAQTELRSLLLARFGRVKVYCRLRRRHWYERNKGMKIMRLASNSNVHSTARSYFQPPTFEQRWAQPFMVLVSSLGFSFDGACVIGSLGVLGCFRCAARGCLRNPGFPFRCLRGDYTGEVREEIARK